ncbi:cobalt-precorrin 5A hydrolase [Peptoclostridium litorale DSM 5388]|uniref:Protein CbiG n=1 Tax=Peptoclostridium litorale DSM 5388 TaxID=1121324 RepID=A0A069RQR0_PEPLI|nr:cobalt-precorrin 5A hydrolase [Peptoclostridium litorale]KDR96517.1 protein CbiG [Peptoclostridium litorale DSM 5388]SIN69662.1 cobalt-precorrin 5A hydrolase [Peptoclostridium litorale DSM 5388]
MRWAVVAVTNGALDTALRLKENICKKEQGWTLDIYSGKRLQPNGSVKIEGGFYDFIAGIFNRYDIIVFVGACGIAVRSIAPNLSHKSKDPGVLVIDEKARFVISLISGHIGGANEASVLAAWALGAQEVITTASDVCESIAVDTLAKRIGCDIDSFEDAKTVTAFAVEGRAVAIVSDVDLEMDFPLNVKRADEIDPKVHDAAILIRYKKMEMKNMDIPTSLIIPKRIVVGIGCRRGTRAKSIIGFVQETLECAKIDCRAVEKFASISIKSDEEGIHEAADHFKADTVFFRPEDIARHENMFETSEFVRKTTGAGAVCEPCGYMASNKGKCLVKKNIKHGITVSIWERIN